MVCFEAVLRCFFVYKKCFTEKVKPVSGGFTIKSVSFMALNNSAVRFYYTGSVESVSCDEFDVATGTNGTYTFIEVSGIEAAKLDEVFTVTVNGTGTITGSAMSYAKMAAASGNDALASLALAIANYNAAANKAFNA